MFLSIKTSKKIKKLKNFTNKKHFIKKIWTPGHITRKAPENRHFTKVRAPISIFIKTALRPDFREFLTILALFHIPINFQRDEYPKPYNYTSKATKIERFSGIPAYKYMIKNIHRAENRLNKNTIIKRATTPKFQALGGFYIKKHKSY